MNYFLTKSSGTIGVVHRVHMAGSWVHDIGIHSRSFNPRWRKVLGSVGRLHTCQAGSMGHDGGRSLAQNEVVVQGILSRRFLATGTTQRGGRRRPPSPLQVDRRGCYSRVLRHIWRAKQGRQPPAVFTEPKTWLEKRRYGAATSELEVGNDGREKWRRGRSSGSFIGASVQAHYEQLPESFL
jgi:hypothetical protein